MKVSEDRVAMTVALLVAAAAHLFGVPALMGLLDAGQGGPARALAASRLPDPPEPPEDRQRELVLGRERSLVSSVAWIPYDDFQKMVGPQSITEQPAVQEEVDPTPQAPPITDATPPAPQSNRQPAPRSAAPEPAPTPEVAAPPRPTTPLPIPDDQPAQEPDLRAAETVGKPEPAPPSPPVEPAPPTPAPQTAARPTPAATDAARPTSAPREPREATPAQVQPVQIDFTAGRVTTPEGLEIRTFKPQVSAIARATIPANPRVALTFTPDGEVIKVTFLRSTGAPNWDSPIEAALYRWKATGPKLQEIDGHFTREFQILLHKLD